jgi:uncharacterized protein YbjT (DUF2867 family)
MIVITTPTGHVGRHVLGNLLDSGEPVRVIARDPSRLPQAALERVEVVQGSHDDIDVVTEAFTGADCVLWVVPPDRRAENLEGYYLGFTRPACEAIKSRGVKRVVGVSTLGRGVAKNAGQISAALAMDDLIESTGVRYRALRMPFFMENMLTQVEAIRSQGMFYFANSADRTLLTVATRDIAAAATTLLLDDSWTGQDSVPVVGPDDLSPDDMARVMSEVLERPVRYQQLADKEYMATLLGYGMSRASAQGLVEMAEAANDGLYDAEPRRPPAPTTFRQWCQEVLKPAIMT